jgi:hypothetical protein
MGTLHPQRGERELASTPQTFRIAPESIAKRKKNILLGAVFSLLLAAAVIAGNARYPQTYNDVLLWSVVGFVLIGNLVNYYRHRRYLRLIRDHRVDVYQGRVEFWTGGEKTVLRVGDIAGLFVYRSRGALRHIQVRLKNNRGIRLEGYGDAEGLARAIAGQLPKAHVVDR